MAADDIADVTTVPPIAAYLGELRRTLRHQPDAADLLSEVEDHLREAAQLLVARGSSPVDAENAAVARFGDVDVTARLLASRPQRARGLGLLTRPVAVLAAVAWLVTVVTYVGQAVREPWDQGLFQAWCLVAAATLGLSALVVLSRMRPLLALPGLLLTGFALGWQADVGSGWRWWVCGSAVGLLAAGGLLRRADRVASLVVVLAWPLAFAVQAAAKWAQLGPLDEWGEPVNTPLVAYALGALLSAAGFAAFALRGSGLWARAVLHVELLRIRGGPVSPGSAI